MKRGLPRPIESSIGLGVVTKEARIEGLHDIYSTFKYYHDHELSSEQKRLALQAYLQCKRGEELSKELDYILKHP
jgi:hypothetical protein